MLSEESAIELVEKHMSQQDLRGYKYEFLKIETKEHRPEVYGVVYNVYSPEGSIIDGPAVFIVDKETREVRVL